MKKALGFGLVLAGIFSIVGVAGCGSSVAGGSTAGTKQVSISGQSAKAAPGKAEKFGTASGWVGQKSLFLSLFTMSASGRYGDKNVRLDFYFGDRIRGTVGDTSLELTNWNGQIHGNVGKYPVYATYLNGHVTAYNGARYLSLNEYSTGFGGWVGQNTVNVTFISNLSAIEKIGIIGVIMTELTPEQP